MFLPRLISRPCCNTRVITWSCKGVCIFCGDEFSCLTPLVHLSMFGLWVMSSRNTSIEANFLRARAVVLCMSNHEFHWCNVCTRAVTSDPCTCIFLRATRVRVGDFYHQDMEFISGDLFWILFVRVPHTYFIPVWFKSHTQDLANFKRICWSSHISKENMNVDAGNNRWIMEVWSAQRRAGWNMFGKI